MSYSNIPARLGAGSNNLAEAGDYPLLRISNNYMLLLSLYRGSWICRKVVDVMAEDMLKFLPRITSQIDPDLLDQFHRVLRKTATQAKLLEALKWGRLFGGAVAVICIEGAEDLEEPLRPSDVLPGQYKGLIVLDRWSGVYPDAELIEDISNPAEFGLPQYYKCDLGSNGKSIRIHHSRLLRFVGRDLPNWEKQVQLYWGMSELELVFDELRKRDYTSWNIVSLLSRAQIMTIRENDLSQALSGAGMTGKAYERYVARLQTIADSMNNQGLLALPKDGGLESHSYTFAGLSDVYNTFMLDVAGACEIPVSRLYGRTITGLGQSGEGDLQIYYDTADQKRVREVLPQIEKLYPIIAASTWGEIPDDMDYEFPPIRTMSDKDRADLAKSNSDTIIGAFNAGIVGRKTTLKELRQQSEITGTFSNITDEMIDEADDEVGPTGELALNPGEELPLESKGEVPAEKRDSGPAKVASVGKGEMPKATKDAAPAKLRIQNFAGIPVAVECKKGERRTIINDAGKLVYDRVMKHDYGFIRDTIGRDGDEIDVILGPNESSPLVFVADMIDLGPDIDKREDEDKVLLGFRDRNEAREAFLSMYPANFLLSTEEYSLADFKRNWLGMEQRNAA